MRILCCLPLLQLTIWASAQPMDPDQNGNLTVQSRKDTCRDQASWCSDYAKTRCYEDYDYSKKKCCKSCGLGPGMTPVASNCVDLWGQEDCSSRRDEMCNGRNVKYCTRTCGFCTCEDSSADCPRLAETSCWKKETRQKCCKSCGLGPHMILADSFCVDIWPAAKCATLKRQGPRNCKCSHIYTKCLKTCGKCASANI